MDAVVMTSGGLDSAVALAMAKQEPQLETIYAVWVNYGQVNRNRERRAARDCARLEHFGGRSADFVEVDVSAATQTLWGAQPLLNGREIPEQRPGHTSVDHMFVPGRNTILLSIGLAIAQARNARLLTLGVHGGDWSNFLDCRPDYVNAMSAVAALHGVMLNAPLLDMTKVQIVAHGASIGLAFNLTWSCYRSGAVHCGACPACLSRIDAFEEAGVLDPLLYLTRSSLGQVNP